ncbi:MAG: hypothetical protein HYV09_18615 [Deltaproteobacteria bacterium]|nr:hypothetical protein [Deltaproteobacteria bacterium]
MRLSMLLVLALAVSSCGKEAWDGRVYHAGRASFRTGPIPASWQRVTLEGAMLAFRDTESGGSINVYARCGQDGDDVPLAALTNHLLIGFTERDVRSQKLVPLDGREALRTLVHAKLDGVPMALGIYVLKKDGCVYDLVRVAPPGRFEAGEESFDAFVAGFGTVGG